MVISRIYRKKSRIIAKVNVSMLREKLSRNSLYLMIMLSFFLTSLIVLVRGSGYWYDEIIVTEISRQPPAELMRTIYAEPHPPGFYFLLKLFPIDNYQASRISILFVSHVLLLLTVYVAIKTGVMEWHKLKYGFFILLSSPFWFVLAANLKQDAVSFPLLALSMVVALHHMKTKSDRSFLLLALICLATLSMGYINFIKVLGITVLSFIYSPSKKKLAPLGLVTLIVILYLILFGMAQYKTNLGRFTWQQDFYQGITETFYGAFGGEFTGEARSRLSDLVFAAGVFLAVPWGRKLVVTRKTKIIFLVYALILIIYFIVIGVYRSRYISEALLLFAVFVGWGLERLLHVIDKRYKLVIYAFLIIFPLNGLINFTYLNEMIIGYKEQNRYIESLVGGTKTGLISRHAIEPYIRKQGYFKGNDYAVPINPYSSMANVSKIDRELLFQDGNYERAGRQDILNRLRDTGLSRFIFTMGGATNEENFYKQLDPEQNIMAALNEYCANDSFMYFQNTSLIVFEDCGIEE